MLGRLQLKVSASRQNVSNIDNKLVKFRSDRFVLTFELNLQSRISEIGQNGYKSAVRVFRSCQFEVLSTKLAAIDKVIHSGSIVNRTLG